MKTRFKICGFRLWGSHVVLIVLVLLEIVAATSLVYLPACANALRRREGSLTPVERINVIEELAIINIPSRGPTR